MTANPRYYHRQSVMSRKRSAVSGFVALKLKSILLFCNSVDHVFLCNWNSLEISVVQCKEYCRWEVLQSSCNYFLSNHYSYWCTSTGIRFCCSFCFTKLMILKQWHIWSENYSQQTYQQCKWVIQYSCLDLTWILPSNCLTWMMNFTKFESNADLHHWNQCGCSPLQLFLEYTSIAQGNE